MTRPTRELRVIRHLELIEICDEARFGRVPGTAEIAERLRLHPTFVPAIRDRLRRRDREALPVTSPAPVRDSDDEVVGETVRRYEAMERPWRLTPTEALIFERLRAAIGWPVTLTQLSVAVGYPGNIPYDARCHISNMRRKGVDVHVMRGVGYWLAGVSE